jgi:TfdA family taurine catabolism dioxygenase TauD
MPTTALEIRAYGTGNGRLVLATPGQELDQLDHPWIVSLLAESGFVLFRDFSPGLEEFSRFVKGLSSRVTLDPARSFHGDVAQKVDAGTGALGLHIENGNSPFAPDLTWFLCERAASVGSETTVCDGYRVWEEADETFRRSFVEQDIVYERRVDEARWKAFVHHHTGGTVPLSEITVEDTSLKPTTGIPRPSRLTTTGPSPTATAAGPPTRRCSGSGSRGRTASSGRPTTTRRLASRSPTAPSSCRRPSTRSPG